MSKIIVQNDSNLSDGEALEYVITVIKQGRISNNGKQYCYVVTFKSGITVISTLNKKSDRFIVYGK